MTIRKFPYPYRAMLAVCSDLDETPNRWVYEQIVRFLNSTEPTAMGPGVGLEVGGTIYFDMPAGQFSYWNTDDAGREMIRELIKSGHIDCLHSYGDLANSRAHAARALDELNRYGCSLNVWIDHGTAVTNFGPDVMQGCGDLVDHSAYHADLTIDQGVRYVWRGRVTSVLGQDVQPNFRGIWNARHPVASSRTVAKEFSKHLVGRYGREKYSMHPENRVLRPIKLRDGRPVMEFLRANPHWGGVSCGETGRGIGQVLTNVMLKRLTHREGVCVLYTHLGKVSNPLVPLDGAAVTAFRRLAEVQRRGRVLVSTTQRTLSYLDMRDRVTLEAHDVDGRLEIDVHLDPVAGRSDDPAGLTMYLPRPEKPVVRVNGQPVDEVWTNPADHTGRPSAGIPWPRLDFPDLQELASI